MGICTIAFLTPQINIVPINQTLIIPLAAHMRSKRAIQVIPLIGLGIAAGIGVGLGGIASSTTFYHTLSKDFTDDTERVAKSLVALQDQLDSLAEVVLQNSRRLGLLTAEKGRLYPFLNEKCCLCVNPSGIARDMAQELRNKQIIKRRAKLANSWGNWNDIWSWALWLLPLTGPLFTLFVALLFGSYILNAITLFITSQIESIKLQMVLVQKSPLNDGEL